jgi:hypothetical protein
MHRRARRRFLVAAAVLTLALLLLLLASGSARADEIEDPEAPAATLWYGWQTLATDGAALFLNFGQMQTGHGALAAYGLGGPMVHLIHARPMTALASFGVRVAFPVLGFAIGSALDRADRVDRAGHADRAQPELLRADMPIPLWSLLLAGAGVPTAMAFDSAVLARDPAPRAASRFVQHLSPSFSPRKEGGFDVSLLGAF